MTELVLIAGASASGKSEFAAKIEEEFRPKGIKVATISIDDYYKTKNDRARLREPNNMDSPESIDFSLLHDHINKLKRGQPIDKPSFSFLKKDRTDEVLRIDPKDVDVIIIEGIFALHQGYRYNDLITVYLESDNYLSYLGRRCERDKNPLTRNTSIEETRSRELNCHVRDGFFSSVATTKRYAKFQLTNNEPRSGESREEIMTKNITIVMSAIKTKIKKDCDSEYAQSSFGMK